MCVNIICGDIMCINMKSINFVVLGEQTIASDFGKKGIDNLTTAQRIKNQITNAGNLKEFSNYNIFTGFGNIADIDLDIDEPKKKVTNKTQKWGDETIDME